MKDTTTPFHDKFFENKNIHDNHNPERTSEQILSDVKKYWAFDTPFEKEMAYCEAIVCMDAISHGYPEHTRLYLLEQKELRALVPRYKLTIH